MYASLWMLVLSASATAPVETKFAQVSPRLRESAPFQRTEGQQRAVVLIQGIRPHPFDRHDVARAEWYRWQLPGGVLVTRLSKDADVFAFAYSQNEAVERIPNVSDFADHIRLLKKMGYREIVLVGHSAGGLVARHFVEDHPDAGVTKVIQVSTPNGGTLLGKARIGVRKPQERFLNSLSKQGRQQCLAGRTGTTIPDSVDFVCVVAQVELPERVILSVQRRTEHQVNVILTIGIPRGDGVVSLAAQWPEDLQSQGIPAVLLRSAHFTVMQSEAAAERIGELVRERQPRWDASKVAEARRTLLGEEGPP